MVKYELLEEDQPIEEQWDDLTGVAAWSDEETLNTDEVVSITDDKTPVDGSRVGQERSKRSKFSKWGKWEKKDRRNRRQVEWKKEYEEKMLEVRRVTRVTTGGRQLAFRATMLIGNKNGKIGLGIAKANDVQSAVSKATHDAYKNIVNVTITSDGTVPYPVTRKFKSAMVKLVPAKPGTGLKAWSSVRSVLELAGYTNMLSKIVGTNNVLNNALLAIDMISSYKNFALRFKQKIKEVDNQETAPLSPETSEDNQTI